MFFSFFPFFWFIFNSPPAVCFLHHFLPYTFLCPLCLLHFGWWVVFYYARAFNANISKWETGQVTTMRDSTSTSVPHCFVDWTVSLICFFDLSGLFNNFDVISGFSGLFVNWLELSGLLFKCPRLLYAFVVCFSEFGIFNNFLICFRNFC